MQCEICGADIWGKPVKIRVEGSELEVCGACAKYGRPEDTWQPVGRKMAPRERTVLTRRHKKNIFDTITDEIISDYGKTIREARGAMGLTVEDLGRKIMEKAALLRKIERGELVPEDSVRKKLEAALNIKLTERVKVDEQRSGGFIKGTTLGDVAIIKRKRFL